MKFFVCFMCNNAIKIQIMLANDSELALHRLASIMSL